MRIIEGEPPTRQVLFTEEAIALIDAADGQWVEIATGWPSRNTAYVWAHRNKGKGYTVRTIGSIDGNGFDVYARREPQ